MKAIVNADREYCESAVRDMSHAEAEYPGWLGRLLTHRVSGLENYTELFATLSGANGVIEVYCEVAAIEKEQSWAQKAARAS